MPIKTVIIRMKWDDPLKCAGILIVDTADELLVYHLMQDVRRRAKDSCATPRLYEAVTKIFTDAQLPFRIIGAGDYREMEMHMRDV